MEESNPQNGNSNSPNAAERLRIDPTKRDARKLFVGGVPGNVTDAEFRAFFESYGEIIDSVVMFDRDTGRSRGFGFVTFADEVSPVSAL